VTVYGNAPHRGWLSRAPSCWKSRGVWLIKKLTLALEVEAANHEHEHPQDQQWHYRHRRLRNSHTAQPRALSSFPHHGVRTGSEQWKGE
jgi:hypothetical protein